MQVVVVNVQMLTYLALVVVAQALVLSIKEPSDLQAALAGVPERGLWENIVGTIPARTVAVLGDAITVPTVIDVLNYSPDLRELWSGDALTPDEVEAIPAKDLLGGNVKKG